MIKKGVKAINAEFIRTRALFQLSSVQFRSYGTLFPGILLSLTLMPKRKRAWRRVKTLCIRSGPSLTQVLKVLFRMWIIWKIGAVILLKRNTAEKDTYRAHTFDSLDCNFSFCTGFLHRWRLLKIKKRTNKALSKHSKQFLLLFFLD